MQNKLNTKSNATKIALLGCLTTLALQSVQADDLTIDARLLAGQKRVDDNDWATMDSQTEIGLMFDIKKESWPVSIAIDFVGSGADSNDSDLELERGYTFEQHIGVRKTWDRENSNFHNYVGAGLAYVQGGFEQRDSAGGEKEDDSAVGGWVAAGGYWDLTERVNLGFDVRYSMADVEVFGEEIKAGGVHNNITLGYRF